MATPQLRRVRWAVRATLTLGVAASVAANILHARQNPISQVIAAWPPLALLLTVELISRIPVHRRSLAAVRVLSTTAIAGIAAWVSYWHMVGVASRYGETGASPYLLPLSVDGLVLVASVSLVELAGRLRQEDEATTSDTVAVSVTPVASDTSSTSVTPPASRPARSRVQRAAIATSEPTVSRTRRQRAKVPASKPATVGDARVRHWLDKMPDATDAEIAQKAGVPLETVEQHRPTEVTTKADTKPIDGHDSDLVAVI